LVAEMHGRPAPARPLLWLQWGRDQLVAEMPCSPAPMSYRLPRFNGAATNWSRK